MIGISFSSLSFALGDNFRPKNVFNFEILKKFSSFRGLYFYLWVGPHLSAVEKPLK
jgi:hypothetical protein